MSTRKLLGDVRKEGGSRWYNYSMSFLSLAQFSLHLCPGLNSARKFTKVANFRDVLAKTAKFTIFMIFRQTLRQNCQNSSPFVMLITTHPQSGAADFTILTEIAKFANFTFFRQNLPRICHHFSPFFMWRKTHPRSDAAGMFYKLSKPCIKFGLQQEKHDMNTPGSSSQVQLRLTISDTPNGE